jgi:hypothetical protein
VVRQNSRALELIPHSVSDITPSRKDPSTSELWAVKIKYRLIFNCWAHVGRQNIFGKMKEARGEKRNKLPWHLSEKTPEEGRRYHMG